MQILVVAAGGAVGTALRYLVGLGLLRALGPTALPLGTLTVNVVGSFLLAVMAEWFSVRGGVPDALRPALTTGLMGGFTTYSTFNHELYRLLTGGQALLGAAYLLLTGLLCLAGAGAGIALVRSL